MNRIQICCRLVCCPDISGEIFFHTRRAGLGSGWLADRLEHDEPPFRVMANPPILVSFRVQFKAADNAQSRTLADRRRLIAIERSSAGAIIEDDDAGIVDQEKNRGPSSTVALAERLERHSRAAPVRSCRAGIADSHVLELPVYMPDAAGMPVQRFGLQWRGFGID